MMQEYRKGLVYVRGIPAGEIKETEDGYSFAYFTDYVSQNMPAVSLTLPLSAAPYFSHVLFPFFDGLIPEGWLLDIAVRNWKLDPNDRFGLLLVSCRDCIGDVSITGDLNDALY